MTVNVKELKVGDHVRIIGSKMIDVIGDVGDEGVRILGFPAMVINPERWEKVHIHEDQMSYSSWKDLGERIDRGEYEGN